MSFSVRLDDRRIIAVTGPDARPFLQGLITNDIERLVPGKAIYAALLTPQGKILFDFMLVAGDAAILIDCAHESSEALLKRLSMYRLRAKVELEFRDQLVVVAGLTGRAAARGNTFEDPRLGALGLRSIGAEPEVPASDSGASAYLAHRLELGVPESADFGSDKIFAMDAGLDELNAIAFDKGCYVGQELTARMKHRGTARKRLLTVATEDGTPLAEAGTPINADGRVLGELVSTYGARGFALIRLDKLAEMGEARIAAGEKTVRITRPAWLAS